MAGIKAIGFEELVRKTKDLSALIRAQALVAAEDAAAQYMKQAIRDAAPRKSGQLASSVQILKGRSKGLRGPLTAAAGRLLIGPTKTKGYYGFFINEGRKAFELKPKKDWRVKTKKALHWKEGGSGEDIFSKGHRIRATQGTSWFDAAIDACEVGAEKAGQAAFDAALNEILKRNGMD